MNKNIILLFVGLASASNDDTRPFTNPDNRETCYEETLRQGDSSWCRIPIRPDWETLEQCARRRCRCPEGSTYCIQMKECKQNSTDEGCTRGFTQNSEQGVLPASTKRATPHVLAV